MTSDRTLASRLFITSVIEGRTDLDEVILVVKYKSISNGQLFIELVPIYVHDIFIHV